MVEMDMVRDEWYEVHTLEPITRWTPGSRKVNVSEALLERYKAALAEFNKVQELLGELKNGT